jgi:hypothetical protein
MLSGSLPDGVSGYWLRLYRPQNMSSITTLRCARKNGGGTTFGTTCSTAPNLHTFSKSGNVLQTRRHCLIG